MTWEGTPVGTSTWNEYRTATDGPIPEADWARLEFQALEVIREVTMGRNEETTDAGDLARLDVALYRVADALYAAETGVVSESLGGYSYTVANPPTRFDAPNVAIRALGGTGLVYRGL